MRLKKVPRASMSERNLRRHSRADGNLVHGKSALHDKIYNRCAQVSFGADLADSLDSRRRGNDVGVVKF